jgi:hypothetical protein
MDEASTITGIDRYAMQTTITRLGVRVDFHDVISV